MQHILTAFTEFPGSYSLSSRNSFRRRGSNYRQFLCDARQALESSKLLRKSVDTESRQATSQTDSTVSRHRYEASRKEKSEVGYQWLN